MADMTDPVVDDAVAEAAEPAGEAEAAVVEREPGEPDPKVEPVPIEELRIAAQVIGLTASDDDLKTAAANWVEALQAGNLLSPVYYERVRRIGLVAEIPSLETGELTPTQKMVRAVVSSRHEQLIAAFGGKFDGRVAAVARGGAAQVDARVENAAGQHADELRLGKRRNLEMQAAHRAGRVRERLVVLHELMGNAGGCEVAPHVGLGEIAARIAEAWRADQFDFGKRQGANAQLHRAGP